MGRLKLKDNNNSKQTAKFDRNVEISAPILDPEIVRAIHHSPNHKPNMQHGGFRELLVSGEEAPEASAGRETRKCYTGSPSELEPAYEVNHLPTYIGISCAVSGYSNYSPHSISPRPLDDATNTRTSESDISRVSTSRLGSSPTPNEGRVSRTSSPFRVGSGPLISHFKLDKSKVNSIEQERRELTGLMAASISERHPLGDAAGSSPIPPTESDRHHGAYVGARYSPMPDPAEEVPKHIPLLGIDDELDPEVAAAEVEAEGKVLHRVASLYGDQFAESWQEDVSNKSKGQQQQKQGNEQENDGNKGEPQSVRL